MSDKSDTPRTDALVREIGQWRVVYEKDVQDLEGELAAAQKRQHMSDLNYDALEKRAEKAEAANKALRGGLAIIASRGPEPFSRPLGGAMVIRCETCCNSWDVETEEHHSPECAYVVAKATLDAIDAARAKEGT